MDINENITLSNEELKLLISGRSCLKNIRTSIGIVGIKIELLLFPVK